MDKASINFAGLGSIGSCIPSRLCCYRFDSLSDRANIVHPKDRTTANIDCIVLMMCISDMMSRKDDSPVLTLIPNDYSKED